jgi:F-type H+-transporting ATPase subunit delta
MKRLTAKQYAQGLLESYGQAEAEQRSAVIQNFFGALMRRRAMKLLPRILTHIQQAQDAQAGVTRVQAWSATPIDTAELSERLRSVLGKVMLSVTTDAGLIGGLRLQIGDSLIDGTLRNRLKRLQTKISEST